MVLRPVERDIQVLRDLGVRFPGRDERENLALTWRQVVPPHRAELETCTHRFKRYVALPASALLYG